jgi:hypothetical protein
MFNRASCPPKRLHYSTRPFLPLSGRETSRESGTGPRTAQGVGPGPPSKKPSGMAKPPVRLWALSGGLTGGAWPSW